MLAISPKDTHNKHWNEPTSLLPFKHQALVPVQGNEAGRLGAGMPIAIHNNQLVGVCGVQPDQNLYIDSKGQWSGNLLLQWFHTSPVYLKMISSTQAVPCIDTPTGCLVDPPAGEPIYNARKQLNPHIQQRIDKLLQSQNHTHKTQKAVTALIQAKVLMPWPEKIIEQHNISIDNLFTLDERALAKLPDADYLTLRKQGAIALGYALSFSLYQLHILQRLVRLNGVQLDPTKKLDLGEFFGENDDLIRF